MDDVYGDLIGIYYYFIAKYYFAQCNTILMISLPHLVHGTCCWIARNWGHCLLCG